MKPLRLQHETKMVPKQAKERKKSRERREKRKKYADECLGSARERSRATVSYTHLTLPTKRIV